MAHYISMQTLVAGTRRGVQGLLRGGTASDTALGAAALSARGRGAAEVHRARHGAKERPAPAIFATWPPSTAKKPRAPKKGTTQKPAAAKKPIDAKESVGSNPGATDARSVIAVIVARITTVTSDCHSATVAKKRVT